MPKTQRAPRFRNRLRVRVRNPGRPYGGGGGGSKRKWVTKFQQKKKPKFNMPFSNTKTKKKSSTTITGSSGDITKSYSSLRYPLMKNISYRNSDRDVRKVVFSGGILCPQNNQSARSLFNLCSSAGIIDVFNESVQTNTAAQNAFLLSNFNSDRKLWCDSQSYNITLTNQGPSLIKLHIYDCLCQTDLATTPEVSWNQGLQQSAGISPTEEFNFHPGSSPTESATFRKNWRVLKKTTIFMPTACNHEHQFTHKYNGLYNVTRALELQTIAPAGVEKNMRGITVTPLIVVEGMPGDSIADGDVLGTVTLAPAKVVYVAKTNYNTRLIAVKGRHTAYSNGLSDAPQVYQQNPDGQGVNEYISNVVNALIASA